MNPAVVAIPLVLVLLVVGAWIAYANGARIPSLSSGGDSPDDSRFSGATGVSIPAASEPAFWWTSVASVVQPVDAQYLPGFPTNGPVRRVTIPNDLLFEPDSFELDATSLRAVDDLARTITDPTLAVVVVCHSSADGPVSARTPLSLKRANSLAAKLETVLGRPAGSIGRIGKGDSVPLEGVSQDTPTGRALHRRCEVFVEVR